MLRVILTPWRGSSQDSNQAPGQDNGLIRRWLSDQRSEEKQDGQGKTKKWTKMKKKVTKRACNLGTSEILNSKTKTRFLAKLKEIGQFWGQMVIILASLTPFHLKRAALLLAELYNPTFWKRVKTKTRFLAKLEEIGRFWSQMVIIMASLPKVSTRVTPFPPKRVALLQAEPSTWMTLVMQGTWVTT